MVLHILLGEGGSFVPQVGWLGGVTDNLQHSLGSGNFFLLLVGLAVATQLARSGLQFCGMAAAIHLQTQVEQETRHRIFRQFMALSCAEVSRYKIGDLGSYADHVNYLGLLIQATYRLRWHCSWPSRMCVLLCLSWPMTLAAATVLLALHLVLRRIITRVRCTSHYFTRASVALQARTTEFLRGLRLIHTFAQQDYAICHVDSIIQEGATAKRGALLWQATLMPLLESLRVLGLAAFLLAIDLVVPDAERSAMPQLLAFVFAFYRLGPRLSATNNFLALAGQFWPFVDRIAQILRTDDKEYMADGAHPFAGLRRTIEFRNVSLHYLEGEPWAVKRLSSVIPNGSLTALVGTSGSGKSSAADLVLPLFDPTVGEVLVDGLDLRQLDLVCWRGSIGVVGQDTFLFNATVRENLAFWQTGCR